MMAASLFAVNKGYFDDLEVKRVLAFEHGLHAWLKDKYSALMTRLETNKALDKESEGELTAAIEAFKKTFA
jgi:F-type H+-transporting ATPase subunit alpha